MLKLIKNVEKYWDLLFVMTPSKRPPVEAEEIIK